MIESSRLFEAGPDPFGRMWKVQFRWLQTGISIRHADTVDVKFFLIPQNGTPVEKIVALPHAELLKLCAQRNRKLTDAYCMRLAAAHIRQMIETTEDMDKTLITLSPQQLALYDSQLHNETVATGV
jgi:alkyl sulfatase BDS1-like metallo-beta-lactamase superfamily hydrolase